jgi:hypothetical protein
MLQLIKVIAAKASINTSEVSLISVVDSSALARRGEHEHTHTQQEANMRGPEDPKMQANNNTAAHDIFGAKLGQKISLRAKMGTKKSSLAAGTDAQNVQNFGAKNGTNFGTDIKTLQPSSLGVAEVCTKVSESLSRIVEYAYYSLRQKTLRRSVDVTLRVYTTTIDAAYSVQSALAIFLKR